MTSLISSSFDSTKEYPSITISIKKNPLNFSSNLTTSSEEKDIEKYSEYLSNFHSLFKFTEQMIYLNELRNKHFKLEIPFLVKISFVNGEYLGEIEDLELYAFGDTLEEVMNELRMDLIDLYEYYDTKEKNYLGKNPQKWKESLFSKIKKINE